MNTLKISKSKINLNEIENFIEDICDSYNIPNSIQGNVIIAIAEIVTIVTNLRGEGKLIFENGKSEFKFKYYIDPISADIKKIFGQENKSVTIESDSEKSVFLIMALCDDFKIDEKMSTLSITFKKEGVRNEISSHRKEYLKNYLGKTIEFLS